MGPLDLCTLLHTCHTSAKNLETATPRLAYLSVCQQFKSWAMYSVGEAVKKGVLQALLVGMLHVKTSWSRI